MILEIALALTLKDLDWLAGGWQVTQGTTCIEEQWTAPSSNMLVGMSRTVDGGQTKSFEFMRIEARADGIYYMAQPGGRPPVDFKLASESATDLVFVNPGHADRLKKVIYRRESGDRLTARIEGENGGKAFAEDYPYRRVSNNAASRCGAVK
jgi:Domain of unknown function (DUF6265)